MSLPDDPRQEHFLRAGARHLSPNGQAWLLARLATHLDNEIEAASNPAGLKCAIPGPHESHGDQCIPYRGKNFARFPSYPVGARMAVLTAQRASVRPGEPSAPDLVYPIEKPFMVGWVPGFGPSDDAIKTFMLLKGDMEAFEREGIGTKVSKEMAPRMQEIRDFIKAWENCKDSIISCKIDSSDIGGKLRAMALDSNTIRSILRDAGKKGYDEKRSSGDVADATNFAKNVAVPVNDVLDKAGGPLKWFTDPGNALKNLQRAGMVTVGVAAVAAMGAAYLGAKYVLPMYLPHGRQVSYE